EDNGAERSESYNFSAGVSEYRWVMKDVPELKEESFTSTLNNHISKIEFQLEAYSEPLTPKSILGTWSDLARSLLEREDFGSSLKSNNGWLSDVVKRLVQGASNDLDKAKKIYSYVRDNITCSDHSGIYMEQQLKNVLKTKSGSVAEVNLLLTAMLNYAGIKADPVILSTSDHGYAYALYPIIDRFNYVVSRISLEGVDYTLDASYPRLGFGKLNPDCYNGHARLINNQATAVEYLANSIKEQKLTAITVINNENGKWIGHMNQSPGYYESINIRDKVKEKGQDYLFKEITKSFGQEINISKPIIDSLTLYEAPVSLKYEFEIKTEGEDILYMNPLFGEGYKENPFKSADRLYPVEMPYTMDETVVLTMHVPKGYVLDELPKQLKVKLNEAGEGYFEYLVTHSNGTISLRSRIKLDKATFMPDEYESLRGFFNLVVSKQSEQIVFKKIK
ncbi:MAG TPA: transglutaminase domain-containing protein, partial [Chitinophagaceae bacterium]|nr:transglutaminase domain-containing protein [Chitinophagaceae bacterium]